MEDRTVGFSIPSPRPLEQRAGRFRPLGLCSRQLRAWDALGLGSEPWPEARWGGPRRHRVPRPPHRWSGGDRGAARHLRPQPSRPAPDLCGRARRRCRRLARHEVPRRAPLRGRPAEPGRRSRAALFRRGDRFVEDRRFAQRGAIYRARGAPRMARPRGRNARPPSRPGGGGCRPGGVGRTVSAGDTRSEPPAEPGPVVEQWPGPGLSRACVRISRPGDKGRPRRWPPSNTR